MQQLTHDRTRFPVAKFQIRKAVIGRVPALEISRADYKSAKSAHKQISLALKLESAMDFLLESYRELEEDCLKLAVKSGVTSRVDWQEAIDELQLIDRRLFNLLNAAKAYIDKGCSLSKRIGGKNLHQKFSRFASTQFDQYFSYRLLEALRNHSQHQDVAVYSVTHHNSLERIWDTDSDGENLRYLLAARPKVNGFDLMDNPKIRKATRDEIATFDQKEMMIDLMPHLRQYISCLGHVQEQVRVEIAPTISTAAKTIKSLIERYRQIDNSSLLGLSCSAVSVEGVASDRIPLFVNQIDRITRLQSKNRNLSNIHRLIFSSELPMHLRDSQDH